MPFVDACFRICMMLSTFRKFGRAIDTPTRIAPRMMYSA